jgi:hypothetical protein
MHTKHTPTGSTAASTAVKEPCSCTFPLKTASDGTHTPALPAAAVVTKHSSSKQPQPPQEFAGNAVLQAVAQGAHAPTAHSTAWRDR